MKNLSNEIENYLRVCAEAKGLSPLTLKAYKIDFKQFLCFVQGKDDYLSKECLTLYIEHLHRHYKPKSAKRKVACVKAFYHYMEMEDIIEINPFHKIKVKYKEPFVLPKVIPLSDVQSILQYAYNVYRNAKTDYQTESLLRNVIILELLFSTGMRVSEISKLKTDNIRLTSNTIHIHGKGSKERIACIINKDISKMIEHYFSIRKHKIEYAFSNKFGNNYSDQSIRYMVNSYAQAAGATLHITPHMFRHTFATALHDEDVNIRHIQQLLGHSSIVTTQIYTHISTNKIRHILEEKHPRNSFTIISTAF